ncbi:uncharacterized protein LOC143881562 isoform X2 [Tasmannia lanceolata]|uniref:uncharacterized protein LOC143881562 isoform X2 n=1 Tax=Tasmannia lanceolata TaxID=3420 RepID=UPI0040646815
MDISKTPLCIYDHGTTVDKRKNRVKCKYCAKVMSSGFSRLKYHLGGVQGDVLPCEKVPLDVKEILRDELLERKKQKLSNEVGQLQHPNLALKRHLCFKSPELKSNCHDSSKPTALQKGKKVLDSVPGDRVLDNGSIQCSIVDAQKTVKSEVKDCSSENVFRHIGRFFYGNVPSYHELKGWILQEEVKEMRQRVKVVKHSWETTGCSLLLDGWTDEKGRNLISFLVDCPQGTIFLRSVVVSDSMEDVDALVSLFDGVIKEVGIKNVVQVITYNALCSMEAVGKQIMEKHRSIFWTVCAVHCIDLMLEQIRMMAHVMKILNEAKTVTKFIYNRAPILKLMKSYTHGRDLVRPSKTRPAMPFLTLENIVFEKENLRNMFGSSTWNTSIWASKTEGNSIAELVRGTSFWEGADDVLSAAIPLVRVQHLIDGGDRPPMGYIYETMDQAKEMIKKNFGNKKAKYLPLWEIIDATWNNHLHSPLHSAGYFLNPCLFYSSDFFADDEVASGLLSCIVRMAQDQRAQDLIVLQLDEYRAATGGFSQKVAIEQRTKLPPALWWSVFGGHCPELQRLAIRILSQTCSGASSYKPKRSISEQLHTNGINFLQKQRLIDLEFVHYNLRLSHPQSVSKNKDNIVSEDRDLMNDWLVETQEQVCEDDHFLRFNVDCDDMCIPEKVVDSESSSFLVKEEPL